MSRIKCALDSQERMMTARCQHRTCQVVESSGCEKTIARVSGFPQIKRQSNKQLINFNVSHRGKLTGIQC